MTLFGNGKEGNSATPQQGSHMPKDEALSGINGPWWSSDKFKGKPLTFGAMKEVYGSERRALVVWNAAMRGKGPNTDRKRA